MAIAFQVTQTPVYLIFLALISFCYWLIFRSSLYGVFDPLVMLLVNLVFSGALVTALGAFGQIELRYLVAYWACSFAFIFGFTIAKRRYRFSGEVRKPSRKAPTGTQGLDPLQQLDLDLLFVFVTLLFVINLATIVYALSTHAYAIFSQNPAIDRVALAASNRWLTVIASACQVPGLLISTFMALQSRRLLRRIVCLLAACTFVFSISGGGSKGGMLSLVFMAGSLEVYLRAHKIRGARTVRRLIYAFFALGIIYFIYVASRLASADQSWFGILVTRVVLYGESYVYFFVENQYESLKFTYNIVTYTLHTLTAAFGIKLIPHNIGVELYGTSTGDYSGFGPNPQHVVEGMIFLGIYLAPLYSLMIGYLTAYTRRISLNRLGTPQILVFASLFYNAGYLPVDITIWLFNVLSSVAILLPLYMVSSILVKLVYRGSDLSRPQLIFE